MQGIGGGIIDVIDLAIVDGTMAGAIDKGTIFLALADDVALIGEQTLMADQQSLVGTLDTEDVAGVCLGELDGGFNRRLQNVIDGGRHLDEDRCHRLPSP
jgi:hypothetical protein